MHEALQALAPARRAGRPVALGAVCSAHPAVLEAALRHGAARGSPVLVEATCNQVNQHGGYTGQTPAAFRAAVDAMAARCGLPPKQLVLGGDHLGPNPWTHLAADAALAQAEAMVDAYVTAGFGKLHLDASMPCAGDPVDLPVELVAARAARLARAAEHAASRTGRPAPCYVVGTEVPPPGGARERIAHLRPTAPAAAADTITAHHRAFAALGLSAAADRILALVVQPGVEFGRENVVLYDPAPAAGLRAVLDAHPGLVFEAHSTDYQPRDRLAALVADGFGVLKVGPGLTFALREALYRLDALAATLAPDGQPGLMDVMEALMTAAPEHWQSHYDGDAASCRLLRHFSYSDRIRYYWPRPAAQDAVARLMTRLHGRELPETLVSQFFPNLAERVRAGALGASAAALVAATLTDVLACYDFPP